VTAAAPAAGAGHLAAAVAAAAVAGFALLVTVLRQAGNAQGRRALARSPAHQDGLLGAGDRDGPTAPPGRGHAGLRRAAAAAAGGLAVALAWAGVIGPAWAALAAAVAAVLAAPRLVAQLSRHGGRHARQAATPAWGRLHGAAERRWNTRQPAPLLLTRTKPPEEDGMKPADESGQYPQQSDGSGKFRALRAGGYNGPAAQDGNIPDPANPVTRRILGTLHALRGSGDQAGAAVPATSRTLTEGDQPMTAPEVPVPGPRASGENHASVPGEWKQVVAAAADFEPEDDGELLAWMAAEVAGMSAYAEALTEVYETCVESIGVDPAAMNAVHDTADAAADAATAMASARGKFAAHYAEVREFAASGGLLPYDGRWITGDGDA
jgi:hypothetical protein